MKLRAFYTYWRSAHVDVTLQIRQNRGCSVYQKIETITTLINDRKTKHDTTIFCYRFRNIMN